MAIDKREKVLEASSTKGKKIDTFHVDTSECELDIRTLSSVSE